MDLHSIVSIVILDQESEFTSIDIYNALDKDQRELVGLGFIEDKITELWEAKMLTNTGFKYYVG